MAHETQTLHKKEQDDDKTGGTVKERAGGKTEPKGLPVHVDLLQRQARALPQVPPLNPHGRREAHQVGPGPPE